MKERDATPWGPAQTVRRIAEGIESVTTASHGGVLLSTERRLSMPRALAAFQTWAGGNWYEEDCDAAIVILAFPEHFGGHAVHDALRTLKQYKPEIDAAWTGPSRTEAEEIAAEWLKANADSWELGSYGSGDSPRTWEASFRHLTSGERVWRSVTSEELWAQPTGIFPALPGVPA